MNFICKRVRKKLLAKRFIRLEVFFYFFIAILFVVCDKLCKYVFFFLLLHLTILRRTTHLSLLCEIQLWWRYFLQALLRRPLSICFCFWYHTTIGRFATAVGLLSPNLNNQCQLLNNLLF